MIHNLSNYTLTEEEFSVLIKGLSFVPTPTKTFNQETAFATAFTESHPLLRENQTRYSLPLSTTP